MVFFLVPIGHFYVFRKMLLRPCAHFWIRSFSLFLFPCLWYLYILDISPLSDISFIIFSCSVHCSSKYFSTSLFFPLLCKCSLVQCTLFIFCFVFLINETNKVYYYFLNFIYFLYWISNFLESQWSEFSFRCIMIN